jgi:hypothetical protein
MTNRSQAGNLDRSHAVGCSVLRDRDAFCSCIPVEGEPIRKEIRKDSAAVYRNIAGFRKILNQYQDLPADLLREMLEKTLEASELMLQATDRMQDCMEILKANREKSR